MLIRRFTRDRRGNFGMMLALMLPMLLGAVAFGVDVVAMTTARTQLQSSLDAAVLAASRLSDSAASREETFHEYFDINIATADLVAHDADIDVEEGLNYIQTDATAWGDVKLYFSHVFGSKQRVTVSASAYESTAEIEVAMVLDNTGSMESSNRIGALRKAATSLVDILDAAKSPNRKIRVALVPFVTAVNIKAEGYSEDEIMSWMDTEAQSPLHGVNFDTTPDGERVNHFDLFERMPKDTQGNEVTWKGCVEARPAPHNFTDTVPDHGDPATLFVPYFAPDEPGNQSGAGNESRKYNNSYLQDVGTANLSQAQKLRSTARYRSTTLAKIDQVAPLTNGPNRACPTPVVPLTDDFAKLRTAIAAMRHWNGSGTNVSEGLAWGWRILSPEKPFTEGKPFNTDATSKVVVLLSDGENTVYGASEEITKSDYGSYGFLASNRFGVDQLTQSKAARKVDAWTLESCSRLKGLGVEIFTVLLQSDTPANRALYSQCASKPENYYPTNDVSQLESVFRKIGAQVAKLYLTN